MIMKPIFKTISFLGVLSLLASCSNEPAMTLDQGPDPISQTTHISLEQAQEELLNILSDVDGPPTRDNISGRRIIVDSYVREIKTDKTRTEDENPYVYVFNFDNDEGYAIMSADTRIPSLLALTESGNLIEGEEVDNPGLALFLEAMNGYVENKTYGVTGLPEIPKPGPMLNNPDTTAWQNIVYKENGYCPVKWGQGSPYNKYCPTINGSPTYVGCVAVATAQLMATYKYPDTYNGYYFEWLGMTAKNPKVINENQIARLMQQLGLPENLNMNYGTSGSGAYTYDIPETLINFGYSNGGTYGSYDFTKIRNELVSGYSVIIRGNSPNEVGGHAWLIHGLMLRSRQIRYYSSDWEIIKTEYENNWYVLCNWGWDGKDDGYFLEGVFDLNQGASYPDDTPSTRDYNFNTRLNIVTGIRK